MLCPLISHYPETVIWSSLKVNRKGRYPRADREWIIVKIYIYWIHHTLWTPTLDGSFLYACASFFPSVLSMYGFLCLAFFLVLHLSIFNFGLKMTFLRYPQAYVCFLLFGFLITLYNFFFILFIKIVSTYGAPGWLSWLSVWLQLRSWSHSLWV